MNGREQLPLFRFLKQSLPRPHDTGALCSAGAHLLALPSFPLPSSSLPSPSLPSPPLPPLPQACAAHTSMHLVASRPPQSTCTLHPTPCTLHPAPYTLHPAPYTLHPSPYTLHPTPYTLRPTPYTLRPTPCTLRPIHYTLKLYVQAARAGAGRASPTTTAWFSLAPPATPTRVRPPL